MPRRRVPADPTALEELSARQHGALSRAQALDLGLTDGQLRRQVRDGRWQRSGLPGVHLTHSGPVDPLARAWVALLHAGPGAVLSHDSAAWLWGLRDRAPETVDVTVPTTRRVGRQPGLRVHHALHLSRTRHPSKCPPVTRLEDTVLDLVDRRTTSDLMIIDLVLRACQRRLTTAELLAQSLSDRKKIRRRQLLLDLVAEVRDGVASPLEQRYRQDVEIAHGFPRGVRNAVEGRPGRRRYRDVRYPGRGLVVELDGRSAHPADQRESDDLRDNEVLLADGSRTLRFGWRSVAVTPCRSATQVLALLRSGGFSGPVRSCGPACTLADP